MAISVIMYYVIVPSIMIKSALETIRNGEDEERLTDLDPFDLISQYSRYKGILELFGFGCVKAKHIPLFAAAEQLGEASIQTTLSVIFITQNYENSLFKDLDKLFGIPFPLSILSLVFSIISVLIAIKRLLDIAFERAKIMYNNLLLEDF